VKIASWREFPAALRAHLYQRVRERRISISDLQKLDVWVSTEPEVSKGDWFKDFGSFKLAGTGRLPKTLLDADMIPYGTEL
jgi:hypothetical protein